MKFWIELDNNVLEEEQVHNLSFIFQTLKQQVESAIAEQLIEKLGKDYPMPEIDSERVKDEVIRKLSDRTVEKLENQNNR